MSPRPDLGPKPRLGYCDSRIERAAELRTDAAAQRVVKDETVAVDFARYDGELMSLEGLNRYVPGDALITGSTGDRWVVSRARFDAKYVPADAALVHGVPGAYRLFVNLLAASRSR